MILSEGFLEALQWVGLVAGFVCAAGVRVSGTGRWKQLVAFLGGTVLSLFLAFGVRGLGDKVIIVKIPPDGHYAALRGRSYFSTTYVLQNGKPIVLHGVDGTLIVNDSAKELEIDTVYYGSVAFPSTPEKVPPMAAHPYEFDIDNVGPDDPPPSEVSSSTKLSFDIKHHLTW